MKTGTLLLSALMLIMLAGRADARDGDLGNAKKALSTMTRPQIDRAKCRYLVSLESANEGVVQSAIGIILQWRFVSPGEDLLQLEHKITDLAVNGSSPAVRFKASLASLVIDDPALVNFDVAACDDCGELFDAITSSVRQMVIGQKVQ
jgi:hypothetical protein